MPELQGIGSTVMGKTRLEAFSDGVLAIIITIMVLELKVPHGDTIFALSDLVPVFLSYILSFVYVGIYWNNHHHLLHTVRQVRGSILWANLHLLFWLSLVPFATGWMGENHFAPVPTAFYGCIMLGAAVAFYVLQLTILASHGPDSVLARAVGKDWKGKLSLVMYFGGILTVAISPTLSLAVYTAVAILWLIPDRRIERALHA